MKYPTPASWDPWPEMFITFHCPKVNPSSLFLQGNPGLTQNFQHGRPLTIFITRA